MKLSKLKRLETKLEKLSSIDYSVGRGCGKSNLVNSMMIDNVVYIMTIVRRIKNHKRTVMYKKLRNDKSCKPK